MTLQRNLVPTGLIAHDAHDQHHLGHEQSPGLVDFLRLLRVRYKIILGTTVVVVALCTVTVLLMTPLYSATAVVMLDQRKNNVEDSQAVLSDLPADQTTVQNQVQILTSLELSGRVVDELKLMQDPSLTSVANGWGAILHYLNPLDWFKGNSKTQADAQDQTLKRNAVIHHLLDGISVEQIGSSTAMNVTYTSADPQQAARLANAFANAYVEDQLEAKFDATQKATQWLSRRIGELSRQAQQADAAVQQYKAQQNITMTQNGVSVVDQQIADINGQLILARTDLAQKQTAYDSLEAMAKAGHAADSAEVLSSPLIATLRGEETTLNGQIADLSTRYGPRHPKMLDLEAQKANLDAKIDEEVQRIVVSKKNDVDAAQARVASLQNSLRQLESQGASQNQQEVQLSALQSAATSARAMYEAFLGRLNQTQGQEGIQEPDARIISNAEVPKSPSFPKTKLVIALSIPTGLVLGLLFALLAERLDSGFRTKGQVESTLGVPVLSTLPEVMTRGNEAPANVENMVIDKPTSSFAEAVRGVQLGLALSNVDHKPKVIVVTSSVPGEGKTTLAVSLARMAARSGLKAVVMDADLRRLDLARAVGLVERKPGLVEVLADEISLEQALSKDPLSDAYVITCLQSPANPADMLASQKLENVIETLKQAFDLVIIDSAPLLPVNDTKILARLADTVLFVVRWEKTPREAVASALRALWDVSAPIAGIALTRANLERFHYYSYGYQNYYNYTKYYSD